MAHPRKRALFVLGRRAARTLLSERMGILPREVPLRVALGGAVDVCGTDLRLSIAHSSDHAVAVVGCRTIGVDLEEIRPRHEGLARRILHEDERPAFEALPMDRDRRVILYWTLKEAALKATRTGLRRAPSSLRLDVDHSARTAAVDIGGGIALRIRYAERLGCWLAVAFGP